MDWKFATLVRLSTWLSLILVPAISPAASVPVSVFSNFGAASSYNTSQGNPVGNAFDGSTYAEGDTFTLSGNAIFSSLQIALSCFVACPDPFTVALTRDAGNQPGTAIETFTLAGSALGTLGANNPPLVVTSVLMPTLIYHTQYWITVSSDVNDSIDWNLNSTGDSATEALSVDGGMSWFSPSGNTPGAFQINGITPEPASTGLILSAGLLVAFFVRRQNSKASL